MIWAMAKADKSDGFPSFEAWLSSMESFDFADKTIMTAVIEEATDGFFSWRSKVAEKQLTLKQMTLR